MCGGTRRANPRITVEHGLSPRVRGNLLCFDVEEVVMRSIPACAGEPYSEQSRWSSVTVYPRVCGGTLEGDDKREWEKGLSPRVRGEPLKPRSTRSITAVYPRVCGGTFERGVKCLCAHGLSPRVRGNPPPWIVNRPWRGCTVYPRVCGGTLKIW